MEKREEITGFGLGLMSYCPTEVVHKQFIRGFRWMSFGAPEKVESKKIGCPVRMWIFYHPDGQRVATFEVFHSGGSTLDVCSSFFSREFEYDSSIFELRSFEDKIEIGEKFNIMPLFVCLQ